MRKIIHIDMDAFYAAVEQRDRPALRERPVAVGGAPERRGVVAAASYEARQFGVRSAMPSARAARLCPDLVFVRPRFDTYRAVSESIRAIFRRFTARIEPVSLDEAYLDVSDSGAAGGSATLMARELKRLIRSETGLTASAGVSYNKFLAKLASDQDKPDGLFVIEPGQGPDYVAELDIQRLHGVGPATARRLREAGIHTGADLQRWSREALVAWLGRAGDHYYGLARGRDDRPVDATPARRSVGQENTFADDLTDAAAMQAELERLAAKVAERLAQKGLRGRTLTVKLRFSDFSDVTRRTTRSPGFADIATMRPALAELLEAALGGCPTNPAPTARAPQRHLRAIAQLTWQPPCSSHDRPNLLAVPRARYGAGYSDSLLGEGGGVRLLGVTVSNLEATDGIQPELWSDRR